LTKDDSRANLIASNKQKFGQVFSVPLNASTECIFRPLTISEYEEIENNSLNGVEVEDFVISRCVFWPENFNPNKFQLGLISSLSEEIIEMSGLSTIEKAQNVLREAREKSNSVTNVMKATILSVKPILNFSLEDINNMTFEKLCQTVTLAEQIIRIQKAVYDPTVEIEISFADEDEEEVYEGPTEDPTAIKLQQALYGG